MLKLYVRDITDIVVKIPSTRKLLFSEYRLYLSDCNGTRISRLTSDIMPVSIKGFLNIRATIEWIQSKMRTWHNQNVESIGYII